MGIKDLTTRVQATFTIDKEVAEYINKVSKSTGIPKSRFIDNLVREHMDKNAKKADNE